MMEQTQPYLVGLKLFEQFTQSYTSLMFQSLEWNIKQFKSAIGPVDKEVKLLPPHSPKPAQPDEVKELKKQVELLTERINSLEKARKSSAWNKSGEGHWAMQK
jgi:ubiquinone biosynthesis protein UbiJ